MLSGRVHVDMYIGEYGINTVGQGQHRRLVPNFNGGDYRARKSSPPPQGTGGILVWRRAARLK